MDWWTSLLLGFVQGVSEFLPISSSGHLSVFQKVLGVDLESRLLFDVLLHTGTLFAVCVAYRQDIAALFLAFISLFKEDVMPEEKKRNAQRLLLLLVLATVPLLLVVFLRDRVEQLTGNMIFIGGALIATSVLLFTADRCPKGKKDEGSARLSDTLIVGLSQVLAVAPGLSRSGTTITAGLLRGFERSYAVRFSFLMSLPAVVAATLLEVVDLFQEGADASELLVYLPGILAAAIAGYLSIMFVRRLAAKGRFGGFALYTLLAGTAVIVCSITGILS